MSYITATLAEPRELVAQYRANARALYKLERQPRGRNWGATSRAVAGRWDAQNRVEVDVHQNGTPNQRALLAALADERTTWARTQDALTLEQERPELAQRLANNRRAVRALVQRLEEARLADQERTDCADQELARRTVPTYKEWLAVSCDERERMVRELSEDARPRFLALLQWDDAEFLADPAFLSRDARYRDQVIDRLAAVAEGWQRGAVERYRLAAADQDAQRGHWAVKS